MKELGKFDEIIMNIIKYRDPFDIKDFLLSNKKYTALYNDKSFWRHMIKEIYNVDYKGKIPRLKFLQLYIKKHFNRNTKLRDLPSRYHWIFYIYYINNYDIPSHREFKVLSSEIMKNANISDLMDYEEWISFSDMKDTIERELEGGKSIGMLVYPREGNEIYLGDINTISPTTIFGVQDPLDLTLDFFFRRGDNISIDDILGNTFTSEDIERLNYDAESDISDPEIRKVPLIEKFIQVKIDEGELIGDAGIIEELSLMGRIIYGK